MAVPSTNDFLTRFPEFGEQSTAVVDEALAESGRVTPESVWGNVHTEAVSYYAAHLLAMRIMQIGLQVGTEAGSPQGTQLTASLYGQKYDWLFNGLPLSGFAL
jgi:hypothetical protein